MNDWHEGPEPCGEGVYATIEEGRGWQRHVRGTPAEAVGKVVSKIVVVGLLYEHGTHHSVRQRAAGLTYGQREAWGTPAASEPWALMWWRRREADSRYLRLAEDH